ncbi:MAG: 5-oxoprolinase subunit PxpB [Planctomycetota bacterium]
MDSPRPELVGDTAVAVSVTGVSITATLARVRRWAEAVSAAAIPGAVDVVAAPGRVTVVYDPLGVGDVDGFLRAVTSAGAAAGEGDVGAGRVHEIPVAYDGPDLDELCGLHGIDRPRFVAAHTEPDYLVEAIGFLPGFGYLTGLPASLATPRRATPRRLVPAGAVGIGGSQTGVYPFPSPGGWNLVGRAAVQLFDPTQARPARLAVGDHVRFVAADLEPAAPAAERPTIVGPTGAAITVLEPGLFTTIQDLGRPGHRAAGVPLSGAADPVSLRIANMLVGNPEDAAGIECTLVGPKLRFEREAVVALAGAEFPGLPAGIATRVAAGAELTLGHATAGCRGYLAVGGGVDVAPVLGSRSTLVVAGFGGFGGRPLRAGDRLTVAVGQTCSLPVSPTIPPSAALPLAPAHAGPVILRIIPGEHANVFGDGAWSRSLRASSRSDRMGVRLEGDPLPGGAALAGLASVAVLPGTVQVPPDGQPIVLLADAQTTGGYPVLGQVIAADLPRAAQLRPGASVRFQPVSLAEARAALREREARLAALREAVS